MAVLEIFAYNNKIALSPLQCFDQKASRFYICTNAELKQWSVMTDVEFKQMLLRVQSKLMDMLSEWQKTHQKDIRDSDSIANAYNKAIIKIMNIHLTQDARLRVELYKLLKVDLPKVQKIEFGV